MKATELRIHNFRSICDLEIALQEYSLLVGINNAGKTTVIDAIRAFYGKGLKFELARDFPRKGAKDNESWVEIEFKPTDEEFESLKDEYKTGARTFRVRNYLYSEDVDDEGKPKLGPYAYKEGTLSRERFYGFKNVGQGKFGEVIYIPAVSKIDEHTKLTGPSALRDLINTVLSSVMEQSEAYQALSRSFDEFEGAIKDEANDEGLSIQSIENDISAELMSWGTEFRLNVKPIGIDEIVKNLIGHEIVDQSLNAAQPISSYGQGFQRSVIYTLIRVAAKYSTKKNTPKKKEFAPGLTWILFEEPEAFLHPTHISVLGCDLREISSSPTSQVLLSTHNPLFATHSIRNIPSICRLQKENCQTYAFQLSGNELEEILTINQEDLERWRAAGIRIDDDDICTDMEAVKYALWLDSKRSSALFSEKVLLVEGPTETALLTYMFDQGLLPCCEGVYVLDTIGKYNMHRFMRLFCKFGIHHYVLYDGDNGRQKVVDATIEAATNKFTGGIDSFQIDLEDFLGIPHTSSSHRKPQHVMLQITQQGVDLKPLAEKINNLLSK